MGTHRFRNYYWFIILLIVNIVSSRPTESPENVELMKENATLPATVPNKERIEPKPNTTTPIPNKNVPRDEKSNSTAIGESIKMVASQLLHSNRNPPQPSGAGENSQVDVRTPPKIKNQVIKTTTKASVSTTTTTPKPKIVENSHAGIAMPLTAEDLEKETQQAKRNASSLSSTTSATTTTKQGLSTWIYLSGSPSTTNSPQKIKVSVENKTEKIKVEENSSKENTKPASQNKPKPKPATKPTRNPTTVTKPIFTRRPVAIGSQNKSDLIAQGSAVNENVMNKIKASVLASVQKNKNAALNKNITTTSTTKPLTTPTTAKTEILVSFDPETTTKPPKTNNVKIIKTKKNKIRTTTTEKSISTEMNNSIESKIAEIELEVSTPQTVKKTKPKRTSSKRKRNKNRRRKPAKTASSTTAKPEIDSAETKITPNSSTKVAAKPPAKQEKPITTQIYNYLSREVMPSVGVGLVSLAGLVGLASYFLYPFSNVVRRAYDVDDRNDNNLYQHNGEIYASGDGGKLEVEMLGEVLEGMPDKPGERINPYMEQPPFRYPATSTQEQNSRYRNVAYNSDLNNYIPSNRVGQQSSENMKGSAYSEPIHYDTHSSSFNDYQSYQKPQPVYKAPESVVLEPKYSEPTHAGYVVNEKITEPIYGQPMRYNQEFDIETTKTPNVETLHLGSDDIIEKQRETGYTVAAVPMEDNKEPQFVVGNIPKELIQAPITVPEHGPRSLRIRRDTSESGPLSILRSRSITDNLDEILRSTRESATDFDKSNEIDGTLSVTEENDIVSTTVREPSTTGINKAITRGKEISTSTNGQAVSINDISNYLSTKKYVESENIKPTTSQKLNPTTSSNKENLIGAQVDDTINKNNEKDKTKDSIEIFIIEPQMTTTTTAKSPHEFIDYASTKESTKDMEENLETTTYKYTDNFENQNNYEEEESPPYHHKPFSFLGFIKNLIEFKVRLGISLLQSTTETLARYFRGMEDGLRNVGRASEYARNARYHK